VKRWLVFAGLLVAALALAAIGLAAPGNSKDKPKPTGGKSVFFVTTTDHGCGFRPWATDKLRRVYKVNRRENGSYSVRREDNGRFVTLAGKSPSANPCSGIVRRGRHGTTLKAGVKGTVEGYLQGTVTGGTFNPDGTCTAQCTAADFIAGFFTPDATFTCNEGYAGCRFNFTYTVLRQKWHAVKYHRWIDRGLDGVHEVFIGDIASS
jgi:hypothetical protein